MRSSFMDTATRTAPPRSADHGQHPSLGVDDLYQAISEDAIRIGGSDRLFGLNGEPLPWLIDLRAVIFRPAMLQVVAEWFWERLGSRFPFQLCGLEAASIPIMTAILLKGQELGFPVTGFMVRKERKVNGLARQVEGIVDDSPAIVVDDIFNSGNSVRKVLSVLSEIGVAASGVFSVIDFRSHSGHQLVRAASLSIT